jgi:hypothetical protein
MLQKFGILVLLGTLIIKILDELIGIETTEDKDSITHFKTYTQRNFFSYMEIKILGEIMTFWM